MALRSRILGVGMRRRLQARVGEMDLSAGPVDTAPVSDNDIATLPSAAQRYLRFMGIIGHTRESSDSRHGRIHAVRGMAVQHETDPSPHLLHATARGQFDLGELTTYVNDALMLAPSMLLTPAVTWRAVDDDSSTSACPTAQSRRPHESMSMSRAAWSTSAPPIAGQLSRAD
jgi:hypothetical protein